MAMIDIALSYAKKGWAVFPVKERAKKPLTTHGFLDASKDETTIKSWWVKHPNANIGIATGSKSDGLVVIDIDVDEDEGKHGDETLEQWEEETGCYIDSLTAITGRGGKHLYFKSSVPYNSAAGYMPDIDIRAEGGYVIAPGSIHPNGKEYFFDDEDQKIVNVQEDSDVEYFLNEYFAKGGKAEGEKKKFEMPEKVTSCRNNFLRDLQGKLAGEGIYTDEEIKAQIRAVNLSRCEPPLSDEELEKTIFKSIEKWNEKAKTENKQKKKEVDKDNLDFQRLRKANALLSEELPKLVDFVGVDEDVPLLVEGTCILSAKSKLGKSWFSLELCDAVSKGKDFLGYKTHKCSTLYLDLETKKNLKQKRLQKLKSIVGEISDKFYIQDKAFILSEGLEEEIEHYMEEDPDIGIIVIDVFQKVLKPKTKDVTEYEYYYEKIGKLNAIAERYHISIILVCHDRKMADPNDPFANILGSTALQGATDQMIVMFKSKYNDPVTHISVKGRTIDGIVDINAQMKDGLWVKAENIANIMKCDEYKKSPIFEGVIKLMEKNKMWNGRCGTFARDVERMGIDLELPKDKNGGIDYRPIGKAFQDFDFQELLKEKNIDLKIKNPYSSGGKEYTFTVSTVSDEWVTVSEDGANPYEI